MPLPKSPERYTFPSNPKANSKSIVGGDGVKYRFTVLTERLVRYEWSDDGIFEDRASTLAVFRNFDPPEFTVSEKDDVVTVSNDCFSLRCKKTGFDDGGLSIKIGHVTWSYDGESHGDLGGTARTLDGANGRIRLEPGILSREPFSVLDDSKSMLFDEDGWIATRGPGRKDGYIFAHNGDFKAAIRDFYALSGQQPLLPRWALGNWWSRYHEYTADEYKKVMFGFEMEEIPLTVAVLDMDWHKVRNIPPGLNGWTGYSWNRDLFPNPVDFLRDLHDKGLKVTVNDHPADGIRAFEDQYEEVAKALKRDTSGKATIEFDCTDRNFLDAYFDVLKKNLEDEGIDFWWIDWQQGNKSKIPGVDPLWVLNHYHYLTSKRNIPTLDKPLTFSRYAGPGSHRYPIGFSGDTVVTWDSLHFQPEFTATASNIGYGWWSHDIGGHMWGQRSNDLMARWVQLGCFSPILRLHSEKSQWVSREPWKFEPEAHKAIRSFLIFRHRLIPYLYTMNVRASYNPEPLIQPMYWNHSKLEEAYSVPNQYYFGPQLIVAPITSPTDNATLLGSVRAWLPPPPADRTTLRYIDIFKHTMVYDAANRHTTLHRNLEQIPVLAPGGTILPIQMQGRLARGWGPPEPLPFKHGAPKRPDIHIKLVVGADTDFTLFEEPISRENEDAIGPSTPMTQFVQTMITWEQKEGVLTIHPERNGPQLPRKWLVELVGVTNTKDGEVGVRFETVVNGHLKGLKRKDGTYPEKKVDPCGSSTYFYLGSLPSHYRTKLSLGKDLQLNVVDIGKRVEEVVYRSEIGNNIKRDIWDAVMGDKGSVEERVKRLWAMDERQVPKSVKEAIMEIWTADARSEGSAQGVKVDTYAVENAVNEVVEAGGGNVVKHDVKEVAQAYGDCLVGGGVGGDDVGESDVEVAGDEVANGWEDLDVSDSDHDDILLVH